MKPASPTPHFYACNVATAHLPLGGIAVVGQLMNFPDVNLRLQDLRQIPRRANTVFHAYAKRRDGKYELGCETGDSIEADTHGFAINLLVTSKLKGNGHVVVLKLEGSLWKPVSLLGQLYQQ